MNSVNKVVHTKVGVLLSDCSEKKSVVCFFFFKLEKIMHSLFSVRYRVKSVQITLEKSKLLQFSA